MGHQLDMAQLALYIDAMPWADPEDRREYHRQYYQRNSATYKARAKKFTDRVRLEVKQAVYEYLLAHPCVDCGEKDPIVLEFDHRDADQKRFDVGAAMRRGCSLKTVFEEIAKCDVRCANCHRRRTYKQMGYTHRG